MIGSFSYLMFKTNEYVYMLLGLPTNGNFPILRLVTLIFFIDNFPSLQLRLVILILKRKIGIASPRCYRVAFETNNMIYDIVVLGESDALQINMKNENSRSENV